ncbi:MAG: hypothetical protein FWH04_05950 [Oscillospiraceae bacterium]|nr:hypothetical protein [Oscillospiraceae bacterium]
MPEPKPTSPAAKDNDTALSGSGLSAQEILSDYTYQSITKKCPTKNTLTSDLLEVCKKNLSDEPEEKREIQTWAADFCDTASKASVPTAPGLSAGTPKEPGLNGENDDIEDTKEAFEVKTQEISLGGFEQFGKHFGPKDTYRGTEDFSEAIDDNEPDENELEKESISFWTKLSERWKGKEVISSLPPRQAYQKAKSLAVSLKNRTIFAAIPTLAIVFVSCFQTWGHMPSALRYASRPYLVLFLLTVLQAFVMLCGIDILAKGATDLLRLRPGSETLVVISCISSLCHAFTITQPSLFDEAVPPIGYMPYCAVSCVSIFFAMWGHRQQSAAYARTYEAADTQDGREPDMIALENCLWENKPGFSKHNAPVNDFTFLTGQNDVTVKFSRFFCPFILIACFVLALISAGRHSEHTEAVMFFWAWSALCCAAAPITAFGAFAPVFLRIASRLSNAGAAVPGWAGAAEMARGNVLVIGDNDIFPPGTVHLTGIRYFSPSSEEHDQVVSYTMSMLSASGSGLYNAVKSADKSFESAPIRKVAGFEAFDNGVSGEIDGNRVLLGTLNFMKSMSIRIPSKHHVRGAVFVAMNLSIAGIFPVRYVSAKSVENAFGLIENQRLTPVLVARDFNITPTSIKEQYDADSDLIEYPLVEHRFSLSNPDRDYMGKPCALLTKDGLGAYAEAIVGGKRLHRFTIINLVLHVIALSAGMMIAFYFTGNPAPGTASAIGPGNLIGFMMIWKSIQCVVAIFSSKY